MRISYRHIKRYKEIAQVMVKYGFSFIIERINKEGTGSKIDVSSSEPKDDIKNMTSGQRLRLALQELGPTYIKMGQILSTRRDLLDQDMIDELVKLRDDVETFDTDIAMAIIEEETGRSIDEIFSEFDKEPVAAASIGQVYNAVLKDGEKVVIKVQRPDIEETIKSDLEILKRVSGSIQDIIKDYNIDMKDMLEELSSQLLRELDYNFETIKSDLEILKRVSGSIQDIIKDYNIDMKDMLEELSSQLLRELDYNFEAVNAVKMKGIFKNSDEVYIPEMHMEYTTKRILVMERIEGIKLSDIDLIREKGWDTKKIAHIGVKAFLRQVFDYGFFHADQHPGNIFVLSESQIAYIDFGMIGMVDNRTLNFLNKFALAASEKNIDKIVRVLTEIDAIGDETDVEGFKGEMLYMIHYYYDIPLDRISIGTVIDKIVRVLTEIDAIGDETDVEGFKGEMLYMIHYYYDIPLDRISIGTVLNEIFRFFRKYKITMPPQDVEGFKGEMLYMIHYYYDIPLDRISIGTVLNEIFRFFRKYKITMPPQLITLAKTVITLEGTARTLDPEFSAREISKAFIKNYYKNRINPKNIAMEARGNIEDIALDLKNLPKQIKNVLRIIEKNNVKISVEEVKMTRIEDCIKELTTQMTMALVLASIIVGSSLIIASPNIEKNMGIKYMAIAGFFISFIIGLILVIEIVKVKLKKR